MPIEYYRYFNFENPDPDWIINIPDEHSDAKADVVLPVGPRHTVVPRYNVRSRKWRGWVGTFIADNLDRSLKKPWHLNDWPKGYTLVETERIKDAKTDLYLYGYGGKKTFRSPQEFGFHAVWLFHREYHDNHACQCTLCTGRGQGYIESIWFGVPGRTRRDEDEPPPAGSRDVIRSATRSGLIRWIILTKSLIQGNLPPEVSPDRAFDLTLVRPYRPGELVWVAIPPLLPTGRPQITPDEAVAFWPAHVQKHPKVGPDHDHDNLPYAVQLLGTENPHTVPFNEILSWRAYHLPHVIRDQIQDPDMPVRVTPVLTQFSAFHPIPAPPPVVAPVAPRPLAPGGRPFLPVPEIPRTFENALGPLSLAQQKADLIQARYCGTDVYDHFDSESGLRKCYQGVWWGAERVWVGDLVRLTCLRQDLVVDLTNAGMNVDLRQPSNGADGRQLLALIKEFDFNDRTSQMSFSAELYELRNTSRPDFNDSDEIYHAPSDGGLPSPPIHYRFRKLTPRNTLIYLPIQIISGGYDPIPTQSVPHMKLLNINNAVAMDLIEETNSSLRLLEVLAMCGVVAELRDGGFRIHPSLWVEYTCGRKSILEKTDVKAKEATWAKFRERERRRTQAR